jgi:hypothetical protein
MYPTGVCEQLTHIAVLNSNVPHHWSIQISHLYFLCDKLHCSSGMHFESSDIHSTAFIYILILF